MELYHRTIFNANVENQKHICLKKATKDYQIDLTVSAAIGDRKRDVEKIDKNWELKNIGIIKSWHRNIWI